MNLSVSLICKFLHTSNFTYKKMQMVAMQRNQELREQFAIVISLYQADNLVFVDETVVDHRDSLRKYRYSIRGKPQQSHQFFT